MNTSTLPTRSPFAAGASSGGWMVLRRLLLACVLGWLAFTAGRIAFSSPLRGLPTAALPMVILAALIYLASHALRILRLALLIGDSRVALRDIADLQLTTAAATLAAPLKLGEIYRLYELANLIGGGLRAVIVTWWERVFDAVFLLMILALAFADGKYPPHLGVVVALVGVFVSGTAIIFFVLPDNLRRLSVLIIRRYDSPGTVPVLHGVDVLRRAILEAPRLVRGKVASLLVLTALIWAAQVGCVMIAYPTLGADVSAASEALLSFISSLLRGESMLSVVGTSIADGRDRALALLQAPLIFFGLVAGLHYLVRRLRLSGSLGPARR